MFKCRVCAEKDSRITELKEQIAWFKLQLNPPPRISHYELETDHIMNGSMTEQAIPAPIADEDQAEKQKKTDAIEFEFNQMVSGSY